MSRYIVDISAIILVPVGIDFAVLAQERPLVKRVLVRHVSRL